MISVDADTHFAAHRFGIVARAGGKPKRSATDGYGGIDRGELLEFRDAGGEVLSRKVAACGAVECWLRPDVAQQARAALAAEAAGHARVIAEVGQFIKTTDEQGARRTGTTVEQYRTNRHNAGARWDRYRAAQRARG